MSVNMQYVASFEFVMAQFLWILWVPVTHELTFTTNYDSITSKFTYIPTK